MAKKRRGAVSDFNWYGRSKIFRALTEKAGLSKKNVMNLIGVKNNRELTTFFTYPKKCMTIEDIEKISYVLRNVDGFSIDEILQMIKTGVSINWFAHKEDAEVLIAKQLYHRKTVRKPAFKLKFIKETSYSKEEIDKNRIEGYDPH